MGCKLRGGTTFLCLIYFLQSNRNKRTTITHTLLPPWCHSVGEGAAPGTRTERPSTFHLPQQLIPFPLRKETLRGGFSPGKLLEKLFSSAPQENDSHFFTRTHTHDDQPNDSWGSSSSEISASFGTLPAILTSGGAAATAAGLFLHFFFLLQLPRPHDKLNVNQQHALALISAQSA